MELMKVIPYHESQSKLICAKEHHGENYQTVNANKVMTS